MVTESLGICASVYHLRALQRLGILWNFDSASKQSGFLHH